MLIPKNLVVFFLLLPVLVSSQNSKDKTEFQLEGSYLFPKQRTSNEFDSDNKGGGIYFIFFSTTRFPFVTGVNYSFTEQYYDKVQTMNSSYYSDMKYSFETLAVPFYFRISTVGKFEVYLESGFAPEFFIRSSYSGMYTYNEGTGTNPLMITENVSGSPDNFKRFDMGLIGGVGMLIPAGKWLGFVLSSHFHFSPMGISEQSIDMIQNSYWKINFGLVFRRNEKAVQF